MTITQLREILFIVSGLAEPESALAHLVLDDNNLTDENINFAMKYVHDNAQKFMYDHPEAKGERIALIMSFLTWLKNIPEDVRLEAMPDVE